MRRVLAFALPWALFFNIDRPIAGSISLLLQMSLVGWIPATIWALHGLSRFHTKNKIDGCFVNYT